MNTVVKVLESKILKFVVVCILSIGVILSAINNETVMAMLGAIVLNNIVLLMLISSMFDTITKINNKLETK